MYNLRIRVVAFRERGTNHQQSNFTKGKLAKLATIYKKAGISKRLGSNYYDLEDMRGKFLAKYNVKDIKQWFLIDLKYKRGSPICVFNRLCDYSGGSVTSRLDRNSHDGIKVMLSLTVHKKTVCRRWFVPIYTNFSKGLLDSVTYLLAVPSEQISVIPSIRLC